MTAAAHHSPSFSSSSFLDITSRTLAYFSMEIALAPEVPTYSGGLGVLAGDTLRSAADMGLPMVAVSLAHRKGYFKQSLSAEGQQTEADVVWSPERRLPSAERVIELWMNGRRVLVQAWRFDVVGATGHVIPVFLLDTDVEGNHPWDRTLTDKLYGGDTFYRLCQETVLGMGGVHMLHALGCRPEVHHMNEGHAALLALGLLEDCYGPTGGRPLDEVTEEDFDAIKAQCVFTTHTPVPAGHDQFGPDQMLQILGPARSRVIERAGGMHNGCMNMTYIALRFARYVNGVAMQHGKVSQHMFPTAAVHAVTNGVHAATWMSRAMQQLLDAEIPAWRTDNQYLRSVYGIAPRQIAVTHQLGKERLFNVVRERTGERLDPKRLTLGFARRVATYKRASLLFHDVERLNAIAEKLGGLQILYAGKAHPADVPGKALIRDVFSAARKAESAALKVVYLENYDWELGALLTQGVDVWVNTPLRPYEASGTSGMKAALNGVPSLSTLDGWWIEGCAEGVTGWAIEDRETEAEEAASLYEKLERGIAPLYADEHGWARMQQHCVAMNGSFFNTQRMLEQYVRNAYFPVGVAAEVAEVPEFQHQVLRAEERVPALAV